MTDILVRDVIRAIDEFAPPSLAMEGDKIGLQLGNLSDKTAHVMLALDAYPEVIDDAIRRGATLLITHHAMLFRPVNRIDTATPRGKALAQALSHGLTIYNAHTNLDITYGGVNDVLAELFDLKDVEVLDRIQNERLRKLVVFVPKTHHERVLEAVCRAGAGHIGGYSHCTFNTAGQGTFLPQDGAQPFVGRVGHFERVDEVRLETVVPEAHVEAVVREMLAAHPYEEVAYDLYPLEIMGKPYGLGRIGDLPTETTLADFVETAKRRLGLSHIRFSGNKTKSVKRVAVLGGAGGRWVPQALQKGADVLLTSDLDHHTAAEATHDGLAMVDATHAALERPVLFKLQEVLQTAFPSLEITVSNVQEDPFHWV